MFVDVLFTCFMVIVYNFVSAFFSSSNFFYIVLHIVPLSEISKNKRLDENIYWFTDGCKTDEGVGRSQNTQIKF